jgi:ABC-type antimicrobial peptide transport system permease subunit
VRIVGVVGHVRHWGLAGDDQSRVRDQLYYPLAQVPAPLLHFFSSIMSIAVRTRIQPSLVVETLRTALRTSTADQSLYEVRAMEQLISASLARQRFLLLLFAIFSAFALLLASLGVYGLLSYVTNQRIPEIGVRMALGAGAGDVMRLVFRESLGMVFLGVGLGLLAALAAAHTLRQLVAGMSSTEPWTVALMVCVLLTSALFASFLPARRASRVDPMSALRQE